MELVISTTTQARYFVCKAVLSSALRTHIPLNLWRWEQEESTKEKVGVTCHGALPW